AVVVHGPSKPMATPNWSDADETSTIMYCQFGGAPVVLRKRSSKGASSWSLALFQGRGVNASGGAGGSCAPAFPAPARSSFHTAGSNMPSLGGVGCANGSLPTALCCSRVILKPDADGVSQE